MDPILENESQGSSSNSPSKSGKNKNKKKKDKHSEMQSESQTVVGERRKFVVTKLPASEDNQSSTSTATNNAHTIHFGTRGPEAQRPHVKSIFKDKQVSTSRPSSAERDTSSKEYETFHGTTSSPRTSLFDIFRLRRKSDSKKHQSLMQNVKAALSGSPKTSEAPELRKEGEKLEESKSSDKKYYHTVTGASSRKYSPITRVMDIFRSKPHTECYQNNTESTTKGKKGKQNRRSSIETTSPTYHKNSYASLDPMHAKQMFREIRGLPKYDPYLSIVQISLGGRDKTRLLLNFFKYHKCHEMIPKSAKVIIFDTQFLVRKTFPTLISHGIRSAPLWDSDKKQLAGTITVTDFIRVLLHLDKENIPMEELEGHTLHMWKRLLRPSRKPLCHVGPDQSLHEAINLLNKNRVHRLLVIDPTSGDVLYILSHKRILRFLFVYLNEFPELTFFHRTIKELKIGTYNNITSATENTTIREAFQLLLQNDISALPVLGENDQLLDVYAKYEVLNLVSDKLYSNLSVTIGEIRNKKKDWEEKLQKCRSSITLYEALELIVRTESHRLLLVDKEDTLIGIVSLSDILVYLNRIIPSEKKVSSLQEIFKPLEENKVAESAKENENDVSESDIPKIKIDSYTDVMSDAIIEEPNTPVDTDSKCSPVETIETKEISEIVLDTNGDVDSMNDIVANCTISEDIATNNCGKSSFNMDTSIEDKMVKENNTEHKQGSDVESTNTDSKENVIGETSESIIA